MFPTEIITAGNYGIVIHGNGNVISIGNVTSLTSASIGVGGNGDVTSTGNLSGLFGIYVI